MPVEGSLESLSFELLVMSSAFSSSFNSTWFTGTHKTWTPNLDLQSGPQSRAPYGPLSKTTNFGLERQSLPKIVRKFESV